MVCDKIVCVKDGVVKDGMCGERWSVTKLYVKNGVSGMVCDKMVCERWCAKKMKWTMVRDKMMCERWYVTKLCVIKLYGKNDSGVWQNCVWKTMSER